MQAQCVQARNMCLHMCMCLLAGTHARLRALCVCACMLMHVCMHMMCVLARMCLHANMHACACLHVHACMYMHACVLARACAFEENKEMLARMNCDLEVLILDFSWLASSPEMKSRIQHFKSQFLLA